MNGLDSIKWIRKALPLLATITLVACSAAAKAGKLKHTVSVADLAQVEVSQLDGLQDAEHAVMVAETTLAGMDAKIEEAKAEVTSANQEVAAKRADITAAKAEQKAAKKNADDARLIAAEDRLAQAKEDLATAQARLKWAKNNLEARKAEKQQAQASLELTRAELELARAQLLADTDVPASANYATADFYSQVTSRTAALRKATEQAMRKEQKALEARDAWISRTPPETSEET